MNMLVDEVQLVKSWLRRVNAATPAGQFRSIALLLEGAPYVWGAENPEGTDCSGTICLPLWLMGYNIRVTADVLYRELFTMLPGHDWTRDDVMAVFYVMQDSRQHADRVVDRYTAIHVTPVVGRNVVLNAGSAGVEVRTSREIREWFEARGCHAVWRSIDWQRAKQMSDSLHYAWDVDPVLQLIRAQEAV